MPEASPRPLFLTVDDEPPIRHLLVRWLMDAGYETREAEDSRNALDVLAAEPAAVAFVDVQMPGPDGLWLTAQIRQKHPHTAVVLATGVGTVPPRISMQSGVLAYLVKPFDREKVVTAARTALQWHTDSLEGGPKPADDHGKLVEWLDALEF